MNLTLAYSPCPNDTFLFYHLVHSNLSNKIKVTEKLYDVEVLNESAKKSVYDVTKLSFFAFFHVLENYQLLNCGSALGRGCGPLLIKKKGKSISSIKGQKILVPGLFTTANLLLNIFLNKEFTPVPVRYDQVIEKVSKEEYPLGVIIHEERFTYEDYGLEKVQDLGEYWESLTGKPIPLGAIAIQKNIEKDIQIEFDLILLKSLELAWANPESPKKYILENSRSLEDSVVKKHIDLYVNQYTKDIGEDGKEAVITLLEKAVSLKLIERQPVWKELFI